MTQPYPLKSSRRWEKGAWIAFGFAACVLLYTVITFLYQASLPVDGFILAEKQMEKGSKQTGLFVKTQVGSQASPLQPGDQVLAVNGIPANDLVTRTYFSSLGKPQSWKAGDQLTYTIVRRNEQLDVKVRLQHPNLLAQWLALFRLSLASALFQTLSSLAFFGIGLAVFFLRPNERAAHALMIVGVAFLGNALPTYTSLPWYIYGSRPVIQWDSWDGAINPSLLYLLLAFPRPRWPMRRYPRLTVAFIYSWVPLLLQAAYLLNINDPAGFSRAQGIILGISLVPLFTAVLVMLLSLFTTRDPVALAQLKWLAAGIVGFVIIGIGGWAAGYYLNLDVGSWVGVLGQLGWLLMPICLAIAITRTHLFDIDLIIRRTLQYAGLTAVLGLVYFGMIVLLGQVFRTATGQESPLAVVISTLAIAALFNPVRRRMQAFIDRRFFRSRYDAAQVLEGFSAAARDEVELDHLNARLLQAVGDTLEPAQVSLWLRQGNKPDALREG